jgi:NADH:ubiquinone oxidoreductase subunit 2 (subunit N)
VLATVASYWYYLRIAWYMWMRNATSERQHALVVTPLPMQLALLVSVALVLYTGLFPGFALDFARESVATLGNLSGAALGLAP